MCYGQTASGKTHTMQGDLVDDELKGLMPRISEHIFKLAEEVPESTELTLKISYLEIYMERIIDLLSPDKNNLSVVFDKQRGVIVQDLSEFYVDSIDELLRYLHAGNFGRSVGETNMNSRSSRSHSIFIIQLEQKNPEGTKRAKLYLVDLAGSEKASKTNATGKTLDEGKLINKSLSNLGLVIQKLGENSLHVPYRDSKLTRLLQDSIGGNSKTTLIINCSPSAFNEPETLSTLRFGERVKKVKNKFSVNKLESPEELRNQIKLLNELIVMERRNSALYKDLLVINGIEVRDDMDLEMEKARLATVLLEEKEVEVREVIVETVKEVLVEVPLSKFDGLFVMKENSFNMYALYTKVVQEKEVSDDLLKELREERDRIVESYEEKLKTVNLNFIKLQESTGKQKSSYDSLLAGQQKLEKEFNDTTAEIAKMTVLLERAKKEKDSFVTKAVGLEFELNRTVYF